MAIWKFFLQFCHFLFVPLINIFLKMKLSNYPILRLLLPLICGICLVYSECISCANYLIPFILIPCILLLGLFLRIFFPRFLPWLPYALLAVAMLLLGMALSSFKFSPPSLPQNLKMVENSRFFAVKIIEKPAQKEKSVRLVVSLQRDQFNHSLHSNATLYLQKSPHAQNLQPGDVILVRSNLSPISPPKNPHSFDNQIYMKRRSVFFTGYSAHWIPLTHHPLNPISRTASSLQSFFSKTFSDNGLTGDEYAVITAVLLGNNESMEPELKACYASAGVSHILCVSGMHVGIIFMIISFLLSPLDNFPRLRFLKALLLLTTIWFYANITGLAPSVKRAATMFTFVTLGQSLSRNVNVFHSLFASMFILLSISPLLLFEIGFQMSYLAVFGIVIFQPKISSLLHPKTKFGNYFWELAAVSIAAQLSTFPLSIYYFGQFPNYFLLSNLSVISLSFAVVVTGVILLAVSWVPLLSKCIGWLLTYQIKLLNGIVSGIESLPGSVTQNICVDFLQMLLFYGIIISFFLFIVKQKSIYKYLNLSSLLLLSSSFCYSKLQTSNLHEVTFYAVDKMTAIGLNDGGHGIVLEDSAALHNPFCYDFNIKNNARMNRIEYQCVSVDSLFVSLDNIAKIGPFILLENQTIFLLSSQDYLYPAAQPIKVDLLCLRNNPRVPMGKLLKTFDCKQIIIDGSNSYYSENRWMDSCKAYQIPCHSLRQDGYFSLQKKF